MNFTAAEAQCVSRGGHLASIHSTSQFMAIRDHLLSRGCLPGGAFVAWIGARQNICNGATSWTDASTTSDWLDGALPGATLSGSITSSYPTTRCAMLSDFSFATRNATSTLGLVMWHGCSETVNFPLCVVPSGLLLNSTEACPGVTGLSSGALSASDLITCSGSTAGGGGTGGSGGGAGGVSYSVMQLDLSALPGPVAGQPVAWSATIWRSAPAPAADTVDCALWPGGDTSSGGGGGAEPSYPLGYGALQAPFKTQAVFPAGSSNASCSFSFAYDESASGPMLRSAKLALLSAGSSGSSALGLLPAPFWSDAFMVASGTAGSPNSVLYWAGGGWDIDSGHDYFVAGVTSVVTIPVYRNPPLPAGAAAVSVECAVWSPLLAGSGGLPASAPAPSAPAYASLPAAFKAVGSMAPGSFWTSCVLNMTFPPGTSGTGLQAFAYLLQPGYSSSSSATGLSSLAFPSPPYSVVPPGGGGGGGGGTASPDWNFVLGNTTYVWVPQWMNFTAAEAQCVSRGGHLASIHSTSQFMAIRDHLLSRGCLPGGAFVAWIGARQNICNGATSWTDGSTTSDWLDGALPGATLSGSITSSYPTTRCAMLSDFSFATRNATSTLGLVMWHGCSETVNFPLCVVPSGLLLNSTEACPGVTGLSSGALSASDLITCSGSTAGGGGTGGSGGGAGGVSYSVMQLDLSALPGPVAGQPVAWSATIWRSAPAPAADTVDCALWPGGDTSSGGGGGAEPSYPLGYGALQAPFKTQAVFPAGSSNASCSFSFAYDESASGPMLRSAKLALLSAGSSGSSALGLLPAPFWSDAFMVASGTAGSPNSVLYWAGGGWDIDSGHDYFVAGVTSVVTIPVYRNPPLPAGAAAVSVECAVWSPLLAGSGGLPASAPAPSAPAYASLPAAFKAVGSMAPGSFWTSCVLNMTFPPGTSGTGLQAFAYLLQPGYSSSSSATGLSSLAFPSPPYSVVPPGGGGGGGGGTASPDWNFVLGNTTYVWVPQWMNFTAAEAQCVSRGGHLASIHSTSQFMAIRDHLLSRGCLPGGAFVAWIGARQNICNGATSWTDGSTTSDWLDGALPGATLSGSITSSYPTTRCAMLSDFSFATRNATSTLGLVMWHGCSETVNFPLCVVPSGLLLNSTEACPGVTGLSSGALSASDLITCSGSTAGGGGTGGSGGGAGGVSYSVMQLDLSALPGPVAGQPVAWSATIWRSAPAPAADTVDCALWPGGDTSSGGGGGAEPSYPLGYGALQAPFKTQAVFPAGSSNASCSFSFAYDESASGPMLRSAKLALLSAGSSGSSALGLLPAPFWSDAFMVASGTAGSPNSVLYWAGGGWDIDSGHDYFVAGVTSVVTIPVYRNPPLPAGAAAVSVECAVWSPLLAGSGGLPASAPAPSAPAYASLPAAFKAVGSMAPGSFWTSCVLNMTFPPGTSGTGLQAFAYLLQPGYSSSSSATGLSSLAFPSPPYSVVPPGGGGGGGGGTASPDWNFVLGNTTYVWVPQWMNFTAAEAQCVSRGGHLASIHSTSQFMAIRDHLLSRGCLPGGAFVAWIGARQNICNGATSWTDGSTTSDWLDGALPGATLSGSITSSYPTTRCAMLSDFSFATRNATSTLGLVMWHGCSETVNFPLCVVPSGLLLNSTEACPGVTGLSSGALSASDLITCSGSTAGGGGTGGSGGGAGGVSYSVMQLDLSALPGPVAGQPVAWSATIWRSAPAPAADTVDCALWPGGDTSSGGGGGAEPSYPLGYGALQAPFKTQAVFPAGSSNASCSFSFAYDESASGPMLRSAKLALLSAGSSGSSALGLLPAPFWSDAFMVASGTAGSPNSVLYWAGGGWDIDSGHDYFVAGVTSVVTIPVYRNPPLPAGAAAVSVECAVWSPLLAGSGGLPASAPAPSAPAYASLPAAFKAVGSMAPGSFWTSCVLNMTFPPGTSGTGLQAFAYLLQPGYSSSSSATGLSSLAFPSPPYSVVPPGGGGGGGGGTASPDWNFVLGNTTYVWVPQWMNFTAAEAQCVSRGGHLASIHSTSQFMAIRDHLLSRGCLPGGAFVAWIGARQNICNGATSWTDGSTTSDWLDGALPGATLSGSITSSYPTTRCAMLSDFSFATRNATSTLGLVMWHGCSETVNFPLCVVPSGLLLNSTEACPGVTGLSSGALSASDLITCSGSTAGGGGTGGSGGGAGGVSYSVMQLDLSALPGPVAGQPVAWSATIWRSAPAPAADTVDCALWPGGDTSSGGGGGAEPSYPLGYGALQAPFKTQAVFPAGSSNASCSFSFAYDESASGPMLRSAKLALLSAGSSGSSALGLLPAPFWSDAFMVASGTAGSPNSVLYWAGGGWDIDSGHDYFVAGVTSVVTIPVYRNPPLPAGAAAVSVECAVWSPLLAGSGGLPASAPAPSAPAYASLPAAFKAVGSMAPGSFWTSCVLNMTFPPGTSGTGLQAFAYLLQPGYSSSSSATGLSSLAFPSPPYSVVPPGGGGGGGGGTASPDWNFVLGNTTYVWVPQWMNFTAAEAQCVSRGGHLASIHSTSQFMAIRDHLLSRGCLPGGAFVAWIGARQNICNGATSWTDGSTTSDWLDGALPGATLSGSITSSYPTTRCAMLSDFSFATRNATSTLGLVMWHGCSETVNFPLCVVPSGLLLNSTEACPGVTGLSSGALSASDLITCSGSTAGGGGTGGSGGGAGGVSYSVMQLDLSALPGPVAGQPVAWSATIWRSAPAPAADTVDCALWPGGDTSSGGGGGAEPSYPLGYGALQAPFKTQAVFPAGSSNASCSFSFAYDESASGPMLRSAKLALLSAGSSGSSALGLLPAPFWSDAFMVASGTAGSPNSVLYWAGGGWDIDSGHDYFVAGVTSVVTIPVYRNPPLPAGAAAVSVECAVWSPLLAGSGGLPASAPAPSAPAYASLPAAFKAVGSMAPGSFWTSCVLNMTFPPGTSGTGLQAFAYLLQPGYSSSSSATGLSSLAFPSPPYSVVPPGGGGGGGGGTASPDWNFVLGNTTYVWVPQWMNFTAAEAQCVSRGGHLASIHSTSQFMAIRDHLLSRGCLPGGAFVAWIGARQNICNGATSWTDGSTTSDWLDGALPGATLSGSITSSYPTTRCAMLSDFSFATRNATSTLGLVMWHGCSETVNFPLCVVPSGLLLNSTEACPGVTGLSSGALSASDLITCSGSTAGGGGTGGSGGGAGGVSYSVMQLDLSALPGPVAGQPVAWSATIWRSAPAPAADTVDCALWPGGDTSSGGGGGAEPSYPLGYGALQAPFKTQAVFPAGSSNASCSFSFAYDESASGPMLRSAKLALLSAGSSGSSALGLLPAPFWSDAFMVASGTAGSPNSVLYWAGGGWDIDSGHDYFVAGVTSVVTIPVYRNPPLPAGAAAVSVECAVWSPLLAGSGGLPASAPAPSAPAYASLPAAFKAVGSMAPGSFWTSCVLNMTFPPGTSGTGLQAFAYLLQPGYSSSSSATGLSSLAFPSPPYSVVPPGGGGGGGGGTASPDWNFVLGNTTYVWVPQWMNFTAAEAQCVSRGGHLASIHSTSQFMAIRDHLLSRGCLPGGAFVAWIGARQNICNGATSWTDGSTTSDWLDGALPGATLSGSITSSYPTTRCAMLSDFSFATRNATSTLGLVMWHGCSETVNFPLCVVPSGLLLNSTEACPGVTGLSSGALSASDLITCSGSTAGGGGTGGSGGGAGGVSYSVMQLDLSALPGPVAGQPVAWSATIWRSAPAPAADTVDCALWPGGDTSSGGGGGAEPSYPLGYGALQAPFKTQAVFPAGSSNASCSFSFAYDESASGPMLRSAKLALLSAGSSGSSALGLLPAPFWSDAFMVASGTAGSPNSVLYWAGGGWDIDSGHDYFVAGVTSVVTIPVYRNPPLPAGAAAVSVECAVWSPLLAGSGGLPASAPAPSAPAYASLPAAFKAVGSMAPGSFWTSCVLNMTFPPGTSGTGLQAFAYLLQPGYSSSSSATGLSSLAFPSPPYSVVPPGGGGGGGGGTASPDWNFVLGNTTYVWVPQWMNFTAAEAQCVSRGGHLASIHSTSQFMAIRDHLLSRGCLPGGAFVAWIGARQNICNGATSWTDGSTTSDWLDGALPGATLSGSITSSYPTTRCAMLSDFSFATRNATSTLGLVMWHGCSETVNFPLCVVPSGLLLNSTEACPGVCQDCLSAMAAVARFSLLSTDPAPTTTAKSDAFLKACATLTSASASGCNTVATSILSGATSSNLAARSGMLCSALGLCPASGCNSLTANTVSGSGSLSGALDLCAAEGVVGGTATPLPSAVRSPGTCRTGSDCTGGSGLMCMFSEASPPQVCECVAGRDACYNLGTCISYCALNSTIATVEGLNAGSRACDPAAATSTCGAAEVCRQVTGCTRWSCDAAAQKLVQTACAGACTPLDLKIASAVLSDDGTSVVMTLSAAAAPLTLAPCSSIFDVASIAALGGATSLCTASGTQLVATLTPSAALSRASQATLTLLGNGQVLVGQIDAKLAFSGSVQVSWCTACVSPKATLMGPSSISKPCAGITSLLAATAAPPEFDASLSSDPSGHAQWADVAWSVPTGSAGSAASRAVLQAAADRANALAVRQRLRLTLTSAEAAALEDATGYQVQVTLTSWLGTSASATLTFSSASTATAPAVTVVGQSSQTFRVADGLRAEAEAGSVCKDPSTAASAGVTLVAVGSNPVVELTGPAGDVPDNTAITLNATGSYDPDSTRTLQRLTFKWTCRREDHPAPCFTVPFPRGTLTRQCAAAACSTPHSTASSLGVQLVVASGFTAATVTFASADLPAVASLVAASSATDPTLPAGTHQLTIPAAALPTNRPDLTLTATMALNGVTGQATVTVPLNSAPYCSLTTATSPTPADNAACLTSELADGRTVSSLQQSGNAPSGTLVGLAKGNVTLYGCAIDPYGSRTCGTVVVAVKPAAAGFNASEALATVDVAALLESNDKRSLLQAAATAASIISSVDANDTAAAALASKQSVALATAILTTTSFSDAKQRDQAVSTLAAIATSASAIMTDDARATFTQAAKDAVASLATLSLAGTSSGGAGAGTGSSGVSEDFVTQVCRLLGVSLPTAKNSTSSTAGGNRRRLQADGNSTAAAARSSLGDVLDVAGRLTSALSQQAVPGLGYVSAGDAGVYVSAGALGAASAGPPASVSLLVRSGPDAAFAASSANSSTSAAQQSGRRRLNAATHRMVSRRELLQTSPATTSSSGSSTVAEALVVLSGAVATGSGGFAVGLSYAPSAAATVSTAAAASLPATVTLLDGGIATASWIAVSTAAASLSPPALDGNSSYLLIRIPAPAYNAGRTAACLLYNASSGTLAGSLQGVALPLQPLQAGAVVAFEGYASGRVTCRSTVMGSFVVAQGPANPSPPPASVSGTPLQPSPPAPPPPSPPNGGNAQVSSGDTSTQGGGDSSNTAAIVGGVVGGTAGVVLLGGLAAYAAVQHRRRRQALQPVVAGGEGGGGGDVGLPASAHAAGGGAAAGAVPIVAIHMPAHEGSGDNGGGASGAGAAAAAGAGLAPAVVLVSQQSAGQPRSAAPSGPPSGSLAADRPPTDTAVPTPALSSATSTPRAAAGSQHPLAGPGRSSRHHHLPGLHPEVVPITTDPDAASQARSDSSRMPPRAPRRVSTGNAAATAGWPASGSLPSAAAPGREPRRSYDTSGSMQAGVAAAQQGRPSQQGLVSVSGVAISMPGGPDLAPNEAAGGAQPPSQGPTPRRPSAGSASMASSHGKPAW
ncbi:hypothetical protein HXX76_000400 [Chlamydomonas incerta]|uniref:C-type lectin domain-containing protein n=1 Tax=Chlamydomonas incerta TaxID=51695 RepID=A0A835WEA0_CHLIN|nr:hypothetical protein HXX76_000400 [Chlamydomonas incerta]|eukprot:KAG2445796.1 hypothetical protein HXX76_000400 [Chlamydomonas incerta]